MAAIQSAIASWLNEAMRYGTCCILVEGKRASGRNARFEDACVKVQLRITLRSLDLEPLGPSVQLGELKAVEAHAKRPDEFVFRLAEDDVHRRLVTLRWNKTGRAAQYGEYAYVLFPTVADKGAFCQGMAEVQRFGVRAVLAGKCQEPDPNAVADPSVWQVQAGQERFRAAMKRWRGQRLWGEGEGNLVSDAAAGEEAAEDGQPMEGLAMAEDAEMHIRWAEALDGRTAAELPEKELRALADGGLPLKYRHLLWPQWTAAQAAEDGESAYEDLPRDPPRDVAHQIEIDLPRTQPKWLGEREREVLGRVLSAYAVRNASVGYCQGMNFIVMIFLLLGFDEAAAFRGLRKLVEDVCPGYHGLGLEGYLRDAAALGVLLHHLCPSIHRDLEAFDLPLNVLALDHFVSLAARVWPVGATARLWDVVLLDGTPALFASFAAVLSIYLPRAVEEVKAAAGGGKGKGKGKDAPPLDLQMLTADVMDSFKKLQGASILEDIDEVMQRTRGFVALMPMSVIDKLRRELTEPPSPSKSR